MTPPPPQLRRHSGKMPSHKGGVLPPTHVFVRQFCGPAAAHSRLMSGRPSRKSGGKAKTTPKKRAVVDDDSTEDQNHSVLANIRTAFSVLETKKVLPDPSTDAGTGTVLAGLALLPRDWKGSDNALKLCLLTIRDLSWFH